MQVIEKNIYPPSGAWNCLRNTDGGPIKMGGPIYPQTRAPTRCHCGRLVGWGWFFSQRIMLEGALLGVFVLRCGTTIKRVDPLCTETRPACFVRVWALEEHACPFEQHGSSKRVAVCKVWRTRGLRVSPRIRLSARESGRAVFQQNCRAGSAVKRRSAVS